MSNIISDAFPVALDAPNLKFKVYSTDLSLAGTRTITLRAYLRDYPSVTSTTQSTTILFQDICSASSALTSGTFLKLSYSYSYQSVAIPTLTTDYKTTNPWIVSPVTCPITFTCTFTRTGYSFPKCPPPTDANTSVSSLSSAGVFSFNTIDKVTYPPGTYRITVSGKAGNLSKSTATNIVLVDPCPTTTLSFINPEP